MINVDASALALEYKTLLLCILKHAYKPMRLIPNIIFQTWKSKSLIPKQLSALSKTFREKNPEFKYVLWDDSDNRNFIRKMYPWFISVYDSYPHEIYRADVIRYFFLFHYGGIYADMDTECLRRLATFPVKRGLVLGRMGSNPAHSIPNAIMMSCSKHQFWLLVIALLFDEAPKCAYQRPEYTTGSAILKRAVDAYKDKKKKILVQKKINAVLSLYRGHLNLPVVDSDVAILSQHLLYPLDWTDRVHEKFVLKPLSQKKDRLSRRAVHELFPDSFMVTYWAHSWKPEERLS